MERDAFPWVDLAQEYRKMDVWLEDNPDRRPKRMGRFMYNWLSKIPNPLSGGKQHGEQQTKANAAAIMANRLRQRDAEAKQDVQPGLRFGSG
jgi:hypothetical protein